MPQSTAPPVRAKKTKTSKVKPSTPKGIKPTTLKAKAPQPKASPSKASPSKASTPEKASALKAKHPTGLDANIKGDEIHIAIDDRHYRIRGLDRNHSPQQLKVNVLARRDELVHLDTFDLYKARSRASFIKATASELFTDPETIKRDMGKMLLYLEQLQLDQIEAATQTNKPVELSQVQTDNGLKLLRDPNLIERILSDLDACGLAGEETNKLICYLACVSRRLDSPLAILIQSGSAAGKTTLMDAVLDFFPEEDQVRYSAMTGQSLYYMGQTHLKHKILAIAEEAGISEASYALKLLQSDGKLTIAAVGKNSGTGRQTTDSYSVEGPVMMFLTTTSEHPDPELQNRCLVLRVNESPNQTAQIHDRQRARYLRSSIEMTPDKSNPHPLTPDELKTLHQNAQRLLEPVSVLFPWADRLTFRHDQTRMRRDHAKYLSLIATIAFLHQFQRPRVELPAGGAAIEASPEDVALANRLMGQIMGQWLDGLLPQTRQLLVLIDDWVTQQSTERKVSRSLVRFSQRQLRESFGWGDFQIRHHLKRLVEMEFLLSHRTGRGNAKEYELLYDGQGRDGKPFLLGLADPKELE